MLGVVSWVGDCVSHGLGYRAAEGEAPNSVVGLLKSEERRLTLW